MKLISDSCYVPLCHSALRSRVLKALCVVLWATQVTGCAVWSQDASESVANARTVVPDSWIDASSTALDESGLMQWWAAFDDPTLSRLVEQALVANNDIAAAQGRLRSARAGVASARGARLPSVSGSGAASRQESLSGPALTSEYYSLGLDAAWEVDLFGRLRGAEAAATADAEGSEASLHDVQRVISADIALSYTDLRDAQARLAIARENLGIQEENLQIAQWRSQSGLGNELDVEQARTAVAQTRASIAPLEQTIATAIHRIDVLLGQSPGSSLALLTPVAPLPSSPDITGIGLPAELLQRRPDVLAAQRILEAEVIRIGVATADLYPSLRLSGFLETSSDSIGGLFDTSLGGLVGSVTAPVFQGGQIRARIEQQKGSADTALANYRASILRALQDVEGALVAADAASRREAALREAEESALRSLTFAEIRYRSGSIDFLTLLDVQRNLLAVQDSRASASAARTAAAIQLFKALGGGWNVAQNL